MKNKVLVFSIVFLSAIISHKSQAQDQSNAISVRAINNFHKEFPHAVNELWSKTDGGGYMVSFENDSVQTRAFYFPKGSLRCSIAYYNEKDLQADIWNEVKSSYYAYDIVGVTEISAYRQKIYMISLENDAYHKKLRVTADELQEVESFRKG